MSTRWAVVRPAPTAAAPLAVVAGGAWVSLVVLQVASAGVSQPRVLVDVIVVLLAVATWCFTARSTGPGVAALCLLAGVGLGLAAESIGTRSALPFGHYAYTGTLVPQVAGVPAVVPLAWFAMGVPAYAVAATVVPNSARLSRLWWARIALGAWALTAWDLFLDPQMVGLGYWRWPGAGVYGGIPLSNYVGWFVVSAVLMTLLDAAVGASRLGRGPLGLYTSMAVVETVGFLGPLQLRPGVAVIGAVGMGLPAAAAWWSLRRRGVRGARRG